MGERTWAYYLADVSTTNIRSLISHPAVEETKHIDRTTARVAVTAERGSYINDRPVWVARLLEFLVCGLMAAGGVALLAGAFQADLVLGSLLVGAAALRVLLAMNAPYIHDEENTHIPLSRTISFAAGDLRLPLRGENHGALPAYLVHASSWLFGTSPLAFRALHVALGLVTIALVYLLTREWYGETAARWAAALLAFNEYVLTLSARATAHVPHFFFVALAVFALARFLSRQSPGYLYAAAASLGLAFYVKEHSALLVPIVFAALLITPHRQWLRGPHPYVACAIFVLLIAPDVLWNLRTDPQAARVTYGGQELGQATYAAHFQRIGGIGFVPYPSLFYLWDVVMPLYPAVSGTALKAASPELPSLMMNSVLGVLFVGSMLWTIMRPSARDPLQVFLLVSACGIFLFFSVIKPGNPPFRLAPVNWAWVESTLIPVAILTGVQLARLSGRWRVAVWTAAAAALLYAVNSVVLVPPA
jgi:4-amino-4-deoxy-L-arabinose transferase-like glycosyltransferase